MFHFRDPQSGERKLVVLKEGQPLLETCLLETCFEVKEGGDKHKKVCDNCKYAQRLPEDSFFLGIDYLSTLVLEF